MSTQLLTLGCICALAVMTHSAVIPAIEPLIVTKSDDSQSTSVTSVATEPTTEGPLLPIKLLEMRVESNVAFRYSRTFVTTLVKNPAKRSQETTFRVLLPETAFISGFSMTLEGKKYDAYVKGKEEAKQIYTDAVSHGVGAAHIGAKARDSNHFTVTVNVEPESTALFNLTYEELLVRRNRVYNHAINLQPGSLVPKFTVVVNINEGQKITTLRVPEVNTGNEIAPTEDDAQNTKAVITRSDDDHKATVIFEPDLEEQKRLMDVYAEKSKESRKSVHSWYEPEPEPEADGVLGQFVVQYDVDRTVGNEVLVNDGYFVQFFAPTNLPPLEKHVVFVLDTSGSMMDRKIIQLREAMQLILSELHKGDYFSIVEFSNRAQVHDLKEADQDNAPAKPEYHYYGEPEEPVKLIPPFKATPENIAKAKTIVNRLEADGGTNIAEALDVAIGLVHKGVGWKQSTPVTAEPVPVPAQLEAVGTNATQSTEKTVDTTQVETVENNEDSKDLEPMIIFLTDGEATIGETDTKTLINRLSEKNSGVKKASLFSLAFGEDADRKFLRKLSLRNDGFMRHIYEASDAALQLRDFYQQVTSPLLAHVNFTYPPDQVKEDSLTTTKFRTYYAGSEVIVAGLLEPEVSEISPEVYGFCGVDDGFSRRLYEIHPKFIVRKEDKPKSFYPLERLWAYLTIKQLLDERDAAEYLDKPKDEKNDPEKKALELALKYSFVTELTSLVVVRPNDTKAVDAESVDKVDSPISTPHLLSLQSPAAYPALPGAPVPFSISALSAPSLAFAYDNNLSLDSVMPESSLADVNDRIFGGYAQTQFLEKKAEETTEIAFELTTEAVTEVTIAATDSLEPYHLEHYPWAEPLLDSGADELVVEVNGTKIHLKLTKDVIIPQLKELPEACDRAVDGNEGTCMYLSQCHAARNISAELYSTTYCMFDNQYAGVCCPKPETSVDISEVPTINKEEKNEAIADANKKDEDEQSKNKETENNGTTKNDKTE